LTIGPPTGTVTCGANGTCLTYDANGNMVEKNVAGAYTEILYSPVGKTATMSGQTTVSAYLPLPAGETLLETGSTGGTKYFWHKDWLGTSRFGSALGTRASAFDRAFAPFGEMYDNFGVSSQLGFTGDTQDTIAGLFDTPNRELSPNQGRWISPDPSGSRAVDPVNPQTWNLYTYVLNDPLVNIDPSGLMHCTWDGVDSPCDQILFMLSNPTGASALSVVSNFQVTATNTQTGQTQTFSLNCSSDSGGALTCPGNSPIKETILGGTSPLNFTQPYTNASIAEILNLTGNPLGTTLLAGTDLRNRISLTSQQFIR
jgi:RHS repeat-associated protein